MSIILLGIPIGSSPANVSLARQFDLPKRQLLGHWERKRTTSKSHFIQLPVETRSLKVSGPQQVNRNFSILQNRIVFEKMDQPGLFFIYFQSFKSNITILQQINVKNIHPVYCAGIRTHNLLVFP